MSPIHDQSYRRYQGTRLPLGQAWAVIAWSGIRGMLGRRWFVFLMIGAWIPFLVNAVRFYFAATMPQANAFIGITPQTFRTFLDVQSVFAFFVAVYVGSGLIANDRRANALQIYLSKPLLRTEYIGGKLAVLLGFLLFVTMVPALLLLLLQVMFSGSFEFLREHLSLIPAVTLGALLQSTVSAVTMLALSSLSKSSRYVAILFTGAVFFTNAIFGVLTAVTGQTRMAWVSISANVSQVTDVIFQQQPHFDCPWQVSLLVLLGLLALSISVLERRVRGVEIVS
jgi:ABC-type transport system involved in multi-copper enzyme maturation permease subunit